MLVLTNGKMGIPNMDAEATVRTFPRMRYDFNAIKDVREMYAQTGFHQALKRKDSGTMRRKLAILPPPIYVWIQTKMPELLTNHLLLRQFLRDNPWFLVCDRSTV